MTDNERYAETLRFIMLQHGVLREIEPGKCEVISGDLKKTAACFEQTEQLLARAIREGGAA